MLAGFRTADAMVRAFLDYEEEHIKAMVAFVKGSGIADEMQALAKLKRPTGPEDCAVSARVYNGKAYA